MRLTPSTTLANLVDPEPHRIQISCARTNEKTSIQPLVAARGRIKGRNRAKVVLGRIDALSRRKPLHDRRRTVAHTMIPHLNEYLVIRQQQVGRVPGSMLTIYSSTAFVGNRSAAAALAFGATASARLILWWPICDFMQHIYPRTHRSLREPGPAAPDEERDHNR
jgi:hypothetical protein